MVKFLPGALIPLLYGRYRLSVMFSNVVLNDNPLYILHVALRFNVIHAGA